MSEKLELNFSSDSQVALELFEYYIEVLDEGERMKLFKDKEKLIKTFADFVYGVKHPHQITTFKK
jgi:hypothetical protein